jgi:hypothetical protein
MSARSQKLTEEALLQRRLGHARAIHSAILSRSSVASQSVAAYSELLEEVLLDVALECRREALGSSRAGSQQQQQGRQKRQRSSSQQHAADPSQDADAAGGSGAHPGPGPPPPAAAVKGGGRVDAFGQVGSAGLTWPQYCWLIVLTFFLGNIARILTFVVAWMVITALICVNHARLASPPHVHTYTHKHTLHADPPCCRQ